MATAMKAAGMVKANTCIKELQRSMLTVLTCGSNSANVLCSAVRLRDSAIPKVTPRPISVYITVSNLLHRIKGANETLLLTHR